MRLYSVSGDRLKPIREKSFVSEAELQKVVEANLAGLFGLEYVRSEMTVEGLRLDTVAFDAESRAFVIIEFKRETSYSVVDQGVAYLAAMLNHRADFVLEYQERTGQGLKKAEVDWTQSRVLFVAPAFTQYQMAAVDFKDLPIELWEVRRYEDNTVSVRSIEKSGGEASVKELPLDEAAQKAVREVEVYNLDTLIPKTWQSTRALAEEFIDGMLQAWPGAEVVYRKQFFYLSLADSTRLAEAVPQKRGLQAYLAPPPSGLPPTALRFEDCSSVGRWGTGSSRTLIKDSDGISEFIVLAKRLLQP